MNFAKSFDLYLLTLSLKVVLINLISILIKSRKFDTSGFLEIKLFSNKGHYIIILSMTPLTKSLIEI